MKRGIFANIFSGVLAGYAAFSTPQPVSAAPQVPSMSSLLHAFTESSVAACRDSLHNQNYAQSVVFTSEAMRDFAAVDTPVGKMYCAQVDSGDDKGTANRHLIVGFGAPNLLAEPGSTPPVYFTVTAHRVPKGSDLFAGYKMITFSTAAFLSVDRQTMHKISGTTSQTFPVRDEATSMPLIVPDKYLSCPAGKICDRTNFKSVQDFPAADNALREEVLAVRQNLVDLIEAELDGATLSPEEASQQQLSDLADKAIDKLDMGNIVACFDAYTKDHIPSKPNGSGNQSPFAQSEGLSCNLGWTITANGSGWFARLETNRSEPGQPAPDDNFVLRLSAKILPTSKPSELKKIMASGAIDYVEPNSPFRHHVEVEMGWRQDKVNSNAYSMVYNLDYYAQCTVWGGCKPLQPGDQAGLPTLAENTRGKLSASLKEGLFALAIRTRSATNTTSTPVNRHVATNPAPLF